MYSYTSFDLGICSALRLPELVAAPEGAAAVTIERGSIDRVPGSTDENGHYASTRDGEAYLYWDSVGAFLVRDGSHVMIDSLPEAEEDLIRLPLLGPVLSLLLHQRGLLVLHASAVAIDGQAVAFIGRKGWGKSTTAAALHARGHALVTDDILAVDLSAEGIPHVAPGFPQLKLRPEAARAALGDDPDALPVLHRRVTKRARRATEGFSSASLPLQRIYVLDRGPSLCIEPVAHQEAFLELTRHTFNQRLVKDKHTAPAHFRRRARLAGRVPLQRLKRKAALDALPDVARLVEEDVRILRAAGVET